MVIVPTPGRRERGQHGAAESARADDDDVRVGESLLRLAAEAGQDALARVARSIRVDGHAVDSSTARALRA